MAQYKYRLILKVNVFWLKWTVSSNRFLWLTFLLICFGLVPFTKVFFLCIFVLLCLLFPRSLLPVCFCFWSLTHLPINILFLSENWFQTRRNFHFHFHLWTGEMLADSTVNVSGLNGQSGHPPPFLLPPPRALMMNPAAYLAAPFLYGNNALRYKPLFLLSPKLVLILFINQTF